MKKNWKVKGFEEWLKKKKKVNFLLSKKHTQPKEKYQDKIQKCVWSKLEF